MKYIKLCLINSYNILSFFYIKCYNQTKKEQVAICVSLFTPMRADAVPKYFFTSLVKMVDSIFNSGQCSVKFRIWNDIFHVIVEDEIQIKTYMSNITP